MGFEFGMIATLNPQTCMAAMIGIVIFIVTFDFLIGFLEYYLEDSPLYNRMVQTVYKELMQMGIISLLVVMYEALSSQEQLETTHEAVLCMEFAHIVLFFVAIFLVTHAFFLMGVSIMASKEFVIFYNRSFSYLIDKYNSMGRIGRWIFLYSPLSSLREEVEFKILHAMFRDTYCHLPLDFDFSMYLQKCQQKYAMRTTEVGIMSWIAVVAIVVANFFRASQDGPLSCGSHSILILHNFLDNHNEDDPVMLACANVTSSHSSDSSHSSESSEHRFLSGSDDGDDCITDLCYQQYTYLFCVAALFVTATMAGLVAVSRVYMLRLVKRAHVTSTAKYMDFIVFSEADGKRYHEYKKKREAKNLPCEGESFRMHNEDVLKVIEEYFDENEKGDEESQLYGTIAEAATYAWETCLLALKRFLANVRGKNRLSVVQLAHTSHGREILGGDDDTDRRGSKGLTSVVPAPAETGNGAADNFATRMSRTSVLNHTMAKGHTRVENDRGTKTNGDSKEELVPGPPVPLIAADSSSRSIVGRGRGNSGDEVVRSRSDSNEAHAVKPFTKASSLTQSDKIELGLDSVNGDTLSISSILRTSPPQKGEKRRGSVMNSLATGKSSPGHGPVSVDKLEGELFRGTTTLSRYVIHNQKLGEKTATSKAQPAARPSLLQDGLANVGQWMAGRTSFAVAPQPHSTEVLSDNFDDIFFFQNRAAFFRAVEVAIMISSLYMAMWITNFITIVSVTSSNPIQFQVFMYVACSIFVCCNWFIGASLSRRVMPILLCFWMVGQLAKVCSIIDGITNVDNHLDTVKEVIEDTMDMKVLLQELRVKIISRIEHLSNPQLVSLRLLSLDSENSGKLCISYCSAGFM
jgi:hypothetical protein